MQIQTMQPQSITYPPASWQISCAGAPSPGKDMPTPPAPDPPSDKKPAPKKKK